MQDKPWLSVLIPVYNVAPYLEACLDSLAAQDLDGVEILVVDDASTDASPALLARWNGAHQQMLRTLRHEHNSGISVTRNSLVDAAQGEYLWFLDSDDLMLPGAIRMLRGTLAQAPVDLVLCDFRTLRERMRLKHRLRGELHIRTYDERQARQGDQASRLFRAVYACGQLHLWSKVFRRSLLADDLRFPQGRCFEDMGLMPDLLARVRSHVYVPEVWIAYRQRAGSILSAASQRKIDDMMLAQLGLKDRLPRSLDASARFACAHFTAQTFVSACRQAGRQGADAQRLALYRTQFEASCPLAVPALMRAYLRRGWWWRALRLRTWLRASALADVRA